MGFMQKMRVLVAALVHKPFAPRPEKAEPAPPDPRQVERPAPGAETETERVADLIAQQKRQEHASE